MWRRDVGLYWVGAGARGTVWTPTPNASFVVKRENENTPGVLKREVEMHTRVLEAGSKSSREHAWHFQVPRIICCTNPEKAMNSALNSHNVPPSYAPRWMVMMQKVPSLAPRSKEGRVENNSSKQDS